MSYTCKTFGPAAGATAGHAFALGLGGSARTPSPGRAPMPHSSTSCLPRRVIMIAIMASRASVPRITVSSTINSK